MHWFCGTAPESGSCLWSPRSLLGGCASTGALCPSHTGWALLGICLAQSFWLYLCSASGIGRKWVWGRPSAAQKRLLFPRIIWGLGENVKFGTVLEEKVIIIWVSWFRKGTAKLLIVEALISLLWISVVSGGWLEKEVTLKQIAVWID